MVKTTKRILFAVVLDIMLLAPPSIALQERSANQTACALIDKNHPAQFVSYDRISETNAEVTLRLHNNTSCSIVVETDDRSPTRLVKLPNGGFRVEIVTSSHDGVRLPLHYLVQDRQRRREPEAAYGWGDSVYHYEILAGQSAVFTVPLNHFRKGLDLAVPFNYAWEGATTIGSGVGGVIHRVYFLASDLPKLVLQKKQ